MASLTESLDGLARSDAEPGFDHAERGRAKGHAGATSWPSSRGLPVATGGELPVVVDNSPTHKSPGVRGGWSITSGATPLVGLELLARAQTHASLRT